MKETELRKHAACSLCGRKIGASGLPLFWVVTLERFGLQTEAMRRRDGLTALLGGHVRIAQAMGCDEEMATSLSKAVLTVCETCAPKDTSVYEMGLPEEP